MTTPLDDLKTAVQAAASELRNGGAAGDRMSLERPKKAGFGDYSTNAAMLLAPVLGEPPRAVAEKLGAALQARVAGVERVEVAGPGFLNLFLADAWYTSAVDEVLAAGEGYGRGDRGRRIQVEFVSANPTGPLTAASGRHAAFGDALARLLELDGNEVQREYYFNDSGGQVQRLGASILARARGEEPPEDGYQGDYVTKIAAQIPGAASKRVEELAAEGVAILMAGIRATLERYRVRFDRWYLEASLYEGSPSAWERARAKLEADGLVYEREGALWLRTTQLAGDEKDRPLVRSTGEPTYLAADVAYHWDKLARGFDTLVNVLGADHHSYAVRLRAIVAAAGADPDRLVVPLLQFVHVVEGGERASMSKRRGDFVTLEELIDEIGVDATRFFMLSRSADSTVDLDLTLAREQSAENPVYYIQYAHARIASLLRKAGEERVAAALAAPRAGLALEPAERELIKKLLAFPAEIAEAADRHAPHRIATYALETAQSFTGFYRDCRVVGAEPEGLESFRIALSVAAQRVIARSLGLLGVSAPDTM
jgi:arginyl-tRNA synthetase